MNTTYSYNHPWDIDYLILQDNDTLILGDHLNGFIGNSNVILDKLESLGKQLVVKTEYPIPIRYNNLTVEWDIDLHEKEALEQLYSYRPNLKHKNITNLVSCFNGGDHVSRQLLVAGLYKFGLYSKETCSKTFSMTVDKLDGHVEALSNRLVYTHCLIERTTEFEQFCLSKNSFKYKRSRNDYLSGLKVLEPIISSCFITIVSETIATSEVPFISEKFLYPLVCKRPWIGYAQPGWHAQLRDLYGFQLFDEIIDYSFDCIVNPVERLIKMLYEVKKFETVSMEQLNEYIYFNLVDKLNYNYNHYMSKGWKKTCQQLGDIHGKTIRCK
jgi:hypothetical protein